MRQYLLIVLLLMGWSFTVEAHNPNVAVFTIEQVQGTWIIHMELDAGKAMKTAPEVSDNDPEIQRKEQLVEYLKAHFRLTVNDSSEVHLGEGRIKVDDHHADLFFELKGMPKEITKVEAFIDVLSAEMNQQNLVVLRAEDRLHKFWLNGHNAFYYKLDLTVEEEIPHE